MPTYLYKNIETGEIYELVQSMRDDAYTTHPETGVPLKRILARSGISFKGSGFYANDSRKDSSGESSGTTGPAPSAEPTGKQGGTGSSGSGSPRTGSPGAKGGE